MSAVLTAPPARGSLLRAEARRFRSRRLVRVLLVLALVGLAAGLAIASTQFAQPSAAGLAQATERRDAELAQQQQFRQQCLGAVGSVNGPQSEADCGPELTVDQLGSVQSYVDKRPFTWESQGRAGVTGIAAAAAALAFLLGATYVGAEWSTRSMVALLFWEPRRVKVMATKLAVLAAAAALLGVVAEGLWLLGARLLAGTRGSTALAPHLAGQLLSGAGRGVLLVVLVGLLGFGVANLLRNTAAAFGFGFVYFAIVENVVRALRPHWQPYLLTDNAVALLQRGGLRLFYDEGVVDSRGFFRGSREQTLTNLHGAVLLAVVTAVVVGAGIVSFVRRDLD